MIVLALLVLVVVVLVLATRGRAPRPGVPWGPPPLPGPLAAGPGPAEGIDEAVARWVDAGLIDDSQASAIRAYEGSRLVAQLPVRPASRVPAVAEAIGYIGGVLAAVGVALLVAQAWSDLGVGGRIGVTVGGAVVLVVAGALVREEADPAAARLRWFLWLAGTAVAGLAAGVLAVDVGDASGAPIALAVALTVAVLSGGLWRGEERPLQQASALGGAVAVPGALVGLWTDAGPIGVAVWVAGIAVLLAGLARRTTLPVLTIAVGGLAMLVGSITAATAWEGSGQLLIVATGFGLLAATQVPALPVDRPELAVLAAVGGLGLVIGGPSSIGWFAQDAGGATGLVVWVLAAGVVFAGLRMPVRTPSMVLLLGGAGTLAGAAVTGAQWTGFAPLFGIGTAVALLALGTLPGAVLLSVTGALGLLGNVPWAIAHFFPGEGRAPLLVLVSGVLLVAVAILLARMGGRLRSEVIDRRDRNGRDPGLRPLP
ncbi:MAG: DUF2157 domain-containing protein [Acidimicrobiales bacterium]|nr:DUF2157 domain-containing protein [Acidimicrobiales bacterium]